MSTDALREALRALADKMEERCGDHCSNFCKICEYRNDLRLILVRTSALAASVSETEKENLKRIADKYPSGTLTGDMARIALRAASETEKLPAKGESHDFNSDNQLRHWGDDRTLDLAKIIADLTPMVERFLKHEIEAPAAHQYFQEEAADKLRKWRKLEAALKADRQGG